MTDPAKPAPKPAPKPASPAPAPTNTDKDATRSNVDANAATQVKHDGGSPVTAGTVDNNKGEGGTIATEGNESPTTVAKPNADNSPATGPGTHADISAPTQDAKDGAVVKPEDVSGRTETIAPAGTLAREHVDLTNLPDEDAEVAAARNEPDKTGPLTDAELDALDRAENGGKTLAELKAAEEAEANRVSRSAELSPGSKVLQQEAEFERDEVNRAFGKLVKITEVVLPSTPDSHVAWGVGGVVLTLGDIRKLARAYVKNGGNV